jgi:hypothetical protein
MELLNSRLTPQIAANIRAQHKDNLEVIYNELPEYSNLLVPAAPGTQRQLTTKGR